MITVGDVIDKLSILEKRIDMKIKSLEKIKKKQVDSGTEEKAYLEANQDEKNEVVSSIATINDLNEQRGWLLLSFAKIIIETYEGKHPGVFLKHKNYDSEVATELSIYLLDSINNLSAINNILWELEDTRRDKSIKDAERLKAADDVAVFNKRRNDVIDHIDNLITYSINLIAQREPKEKNDGKKESSDNG